MKKQMNEYVLLLNSGDATPLPAAGAESFHTNFNQWAEKSGAAADIVRTETAQDASVHVVCTEDVARRAIEAFSTVATIHMHRENVITLVGDLPKKVRRAGFGVQ